MNIIIDQFQVEDLRIFVLKLSFDNINTLYYGWLNSLHESNVQTNNPGPQSTTTITVFLLIVGVFLADCL